MPRFDVVQVFVFVPIGAVLYLFENDDWLCFWAGTSWVRSSLLQQVRLQQVRLVLTGFRLDLGVFLVRSNALELEAKAFAFPPFDEVVCAGVLCVWRSSPSLIHIILIDASEVQNDRHMKMHVDMASCMRCVKIATWLILPVVIRSSQRLSHACLSINLLL